MIFLMWLSWIWRIVIWQWWNNLVKDKGLPGPWRLLRLGLYVALLAWKQAKSITFSHFWNKVIFWFCFLNILIRTTKTQCPLYSEQQPNSIKNRVKMNMSIRYHVVFTFMENLWMSMVPALTKDGDVEWYTALVHFVWLSHWYVSQWFWVLM